ncbi:MAG: hypothetical protein ACRDVC_09915 [Acidimicrobiales bacterium]
MIWFAWRQHRDSAYVVFGLLLALAIAFLVTGIHLFHVYDTVVKGCAARGDCSSVTQTFQSSDPSLQHLTQAGGILLPAFLGAFWGAPLLAREFESDTFRLAWTQSVSRTKWLVCKLGLVALVSVVVEALFTAMSTWWNRPFDHLNNLPFSVFDTRDIVPLGYALFAVTLGVVIGVLVRRTVPAMALTFAAFASVRVVFNEDIRPHFATPLRAITKFVPPFASSTGGAPTKVNAVWSGPNGPGSGWILSTDTLNSSGKVIGTHGGIGPNGNISFQPLANGSARFVGVGTCPNKFPAAPIRGLGHVSVGPNSALASATDKCINSFHLQSLVTYQPADRLWTFQWYELGSYVMLSLLLAAFSVWWIRRR